MTVVRVDICKLLVVCLQALVLVEQACRDVLFVVLGLYESLVESCHGEDSIQNKGIGHAIVERHVLPHAGVAVVSRDAHVCRSCVVMDETKLFMPVQAGMRLSAGVWREV